MTIETLDDLFIHTLSEMYHAEQQFLGALEQMAGLATDKTLQKLLQQHHNQTTRQVQHVEKAFDVLNGKPQPVKSATAAALIDEGTKLIKAATRNPAMVDYVLASVQSKIEHYEIACYRGLLTTARHLGQNAVVPFLEQNLAQEERTAQEIEDCAPVLLEHGLSEQAFSG